jgi:uncharacterized protein
MTKGETMMKKDERSVLDRRTFLRTTLGGLMLTAASPLMAGVPEAQQTATSPAGEGSGRIRQYRDLGKTGLKVSDIGLGAASISDPAVIQYALDLGVTYFDTAEGYGRGRSESTIGKVAAKSRNKMVICTKFEMDGKTTVQDMVTKCEASLKRLQTTQVDILMVHGGDPDALKNEAVFKGFEQLKKEGKIRFSGVSHHGPGITTDLMPIVKEKKVDVVLSSFDPITYPDLADFYKVAETSGVGLVAMKVFQSARKAKLDEFKSGKLPFDQAALKWALQDPWLDCVLASANTLDQLDEYLKMSGSGKRP